MSPQRPRWPRLESLKQPGVSVEGRWKKAAVGLRHSKSRQEILGRNLSALGVAENPSRLASVLTFFYRSFY